MKKVSTPFLLLCILVLLTGCWKSGEPKASSNLATSPYKRTEFLMGTVVTVKIYDKDKESVLTPVFERIQILANQITVNEKDSVIADVNANAGVRPVAVSEDIFELIKAGQSYSGLTKGAFDISVGPLTSLWHIGFPDARKPEQAEIDAALEKIDYKQVELNDKNHTIFLKQKGMQLDLGAIAKGFITDEVVKVLKAHNVQSAIVDLGGNIFVLGKNPTNENWTVGIQNPFLPRGEIIGKLPESNHSIVTSGIYERYLEVGQIKYHHLLNPKDGYPFNNDIAGVSVISKKSIDGDALSTSIFSKGIKEGLDFVEELDNVEAIFISTDKKVFITSGLKNSFELTSTDFESANF
ncbi:FAD:protein FMN transferase [Bacillus niameyensis]|uniref:FAD:protein FMN transferase n=1 Tax=Bacillus niameyensis TaxID=1522308 RepID=UPI000780DF93|nr:FAD:protein FMN transferase [Bacillus niameyensis]